MDLHKFADIITSIRLRILEILKEEKHPEDLARELGITRQGVDKHLSILYRYSFVDKKVKMDKRPMVFYRITSEGEDFLANFENMVQEHVMSVRNRYKDEIFNLDRMLVDGEIGESEYWRLRKKLEVRYEWLNLK